MIVEGRLHNLAHTDNQSIHLRGEEPAAPQVNSNFLNSLIVDNKCLTLILAHDRLLGFGEVEQKAIDFSK